MNKKLLLYLMINILCLAASFTSIAEPEKTITVSAAISLKNAFEEIGNLYTLRYRMKCIFNFGASGDLVKQMAGGAPVDVFASASQKDMDEAAGLGLIHADTRVNFAANGIVLIIPSGSAVSLASFDGLTGKGIQYIAIGNPRTVPAGRYAEEVLYSYGQLPVLKNKFIYTENVRQVLDYVARDEVDAGVVYATDVIVRSKEVRVIAVAPEKSHKPIVYPICAVKGTKRMANSRAFISMVLSRDGNTILQKYGFKKVN
ncbi:MAG: molybdate ABC transporter substrate-binding protein [Pseudomonadota bacterium]